MGRAYLKKDLNRDLNRELHKGLSKVLRRSVVEGAIKACQGLGRSKEDAVSWIQEKYSVSQENAITYVNQYWM